jgi:hypothetical protein
MTTSVYETILKGAESEKKSFLCVYYEPHTVRLVYSRSFFLFYFLEYLAFSLIYLDSEVFLKILIIYYYHIIENICLYTLSILFFHVLNDIRLFFISYF